SRASEFFQMRWWLLLRPDRFLLCPVKIATSVPGQCLSKRFSPPLSHRLSVMCELVGTPSLHSPKEGSRSACRRADCRFLSALSLQIDCSVKWQVRLTRNG